MSTTRMSPKLDQLFRRFTNAHFASSADECREGASDAAVARRGAASDLAEKEFIAAVVDGEQLADALRQMVTAYYLTLSGEDLRKFERMVMPSLEAFANSPACQQHAP